MPVSIEEYIFARNIPQWSAIPGEQKAQLVSEARNLTYRAGGNGRLVIVVVIALVLSFSLFTVLPSLLFDSEWTGPVGAGLACVATLAVASTTRARQMLPALKALVSDITSTEAQ